MYLLSLLYNLMHSWWKSVEQFTQKWKIVIIYSSSIVPNLYEFLSSVKHKCFKEYIL